MLRKYLEIQHDMEEIENSIHVKAYVMMRQLSLSIQTFEKNYQLFKEHLETNDDFDFQIQLGTFNRNPLKWDYHYIEQETYRQLLNLVASAQSLVDHTRILIDKVYSETEFQKEYHEKLDKELKYHPTQRFIQKLRNYILHVQFPFVSTQFQHKRVSPLGDPDALFTASVKLTLCKKELLIWDGWKEHAKLYLEIQGELIFLDLLVDEYYLLISNFQPWLNQRQKKMHESEYLLLFKKWEDLYQELERSVSAGS